MNTNPRFVFFGTPEMAVYVLEELEKKRLLPSLVITAPDRPQGRGMTLTAPPVKEWAQTRDIPVLQPQKLDEETIHALEENGPWDLFVVAAYGMIIPQAIIDLPKKGVLNVHPSLLPRFRGASPIQSQILGDEKMVGITIMLIDAKLDHGPILTQKQIEVSQWPPQASVLEEMLAREGGKLLGEVIPNWLTGDIEATEQEHEKATFTKKISKADGEINLDDDPYTNYLKIQAFDRWPRTYFYHSTNGNRIRVIVSKSSFRDGKLVIERVIPEGKSEMSYEDFQHGYRVKEE